ncbi:MAG: histidinol-phosphate transaminase [Anaerolineae bacterium]
MSKTANPTHPYLETLEPYEPPDLEAAAARSGLRVEQLIRLDANENPFGPSPRAAQALADFDEYHFHPDYRLPKEAVARYAGVTPEQVVLSNGADEMIDLLVRLFVEPGQAVVTCPPTFNMYRFCAQVNRCRVLTAPRRADLSLDVEGIESAVRASEGDARLLFLASPGNPSGQAIPPDTIRRLLALPLTVAVDEAYIEFGGESSVPLLAEHENLIIIRTFSKWAAMAGLRLGYGLLTPRLADCLERIRSPYNVNAAAMVAALATFDDLESVRANVARLIAERERLRKALATLPWLEPLPTQTNFVLCHLADRTPQEVADALIRRGILIRAFSDPALAEYVRITVGRPEQNEALLAALRELSREGK